MQCSFLLCRCDVRAATSPLPEWMKAGRKVRQPEVVPETIGPEAGHKVAQPEASP
jgi:hypothetical protein